MTQSDQLKNATINENELFGEILAEYGIIKESQGYDEYRYVLLNRVARKMSRSKRSVDMISQLLELIFISSDALAISSEPKKQYDCILYKFKILKDVATSCKVSIQDILRYSNTKIAGMITELLIINSDTIFVIEHFLTIHFYRSIILPKSWFYLLSNNLLTADVLQNNLLKIYWADQPLLSLQYLKVTLFECFAQISWSPKLSMSQKKNMVQMVRNSFQFENEQELVNLYNSKIDEKHGFFESRVLLALMKKLGMGKKYFLEKLLLRSEKSKTLVFYKMDEYLMLEVYKRKGANKSTNKLNKCFVTALEFLNKEMKKNVSLQVSDYAVCFLDAFHLQFPYALNSESDSMKRQNNLICFIKTIEIFQEQQLIDDKFFRASIISSGLYVLNLGIEQEDTVDISIYSLQLLLNAIGIRASMDYFDRVFSLVVHAFLNFPKNIKIQKYTKKIFDYYIKEKQSLTQGYFKDIQFVLLRKLQEIPAIKDTVIIVAQDLYKSTDDIAENLKNHVLTLQSSNEDIRILNTMYILELLEQQEQDEIRKVLVSEDVLRLLYQGLLSLQYNYKTEKNKQLTVVAAKCVAMIGLCQNFVNARMTLKATNQMTECSRKKDSMAPETYGAANVVRSDHHNPITNLKYKSQEQDNTLEWLAVPILSEIQLHKSDVIKFAEQLLEKIAKMTLQSDLKPKNYYFAQFLINKFITLQRKLKGLNHDEDPNSDNAEKFYQKQEQLGNSVQRFVAFDLNQYMTLQNHREDSSLKSFAYFLIYKIEDKTWQTLFEACIPLLQNDLDILQEILPYLIYYSLRFNLTDVKLSHTIGSHMDDILRSQMPFQIEIILKCQDFLKIALNHDKQIFKTFIENDTKFKYVEKLFYVEFDISKAKDQNIVNFLKIIESNPQVKSSFLTVQKIKSLFLKIEKYSKVLGSKIIKNYKRCVYNFEDHYRAAFIQSNTQNKGFLDILSQEETIEIVNLHKNLNPEDFDAPIFNSIIQHQKNYSKSKYPVLENLSLYNYANETKEMQQQIVFMFQDRYVNDAWKNGQWNDVVKWCEGLDVGLLHTNISFIDSESDNLIQNFEYLVAIFVAEFYKGLKYFLSQGEIGTENDQYLKSLKNLDNFLKILYHEFMLHVDEKQGETSYYFKLYLHVTYELESALHFLKDVIFAERDKIQEILKKEVNKDKRRFEKIYYEFDMNNYFEKLLSWFEERSQNIQSSTESLKLIYYVRRMIFRMFDRENEYAFYLMRLAQLYRKTSNEVLVINKLFKECETMSHRIIDYDLEYAKYTLKTKNAHEAYQYLLSKLDILRKKCDDMYKATRFHWMPQRVYERALLLSIELQIKLDPRNPNIIVKFDEFIKNLQKNTWEKPMFKYAQYLDHIDLPTSANSKNGDIDKSAQKKRTIQKIFYYVNSLKYGHKYIWQSLPRALELWFDFNDAESDVERINNFMKQELQRLEHFKLASVMQIILSRYGHSKEQVREIIISILAKIAIMFPGQCAWWIFHFLHFDQETAQPPGAGRRGQSHLRMQTITRADFARQLLNKILASNEHSYKKIMESEKIFVDLKKLCEKSPPSPTQSTMEMPKTLQNVTASNLVMPTEENLSPQLPPANYKVNFIQTSLVSTMNPIVVYNPQNAEIRFLMGPQDDNLNEDGTNKQHDYPAFKLKPSTIAGFYHEVTIMLSKEKPKKIGIIGSDRNFYNFLLKCDKYGDLRKEQRFIEFAVLCNKMLVNDSESRKRDLKLRTYAIVPLSRTSGLIEWVHNTSTLKTIVGDYWRKNTVKGEMTDIKARAQSLKAGETHTPIWHVIKEEIKPVLGTWMADHFPSPEIWYEARINFIRSTAIWSMIGYVIGLGDRHGDNILIHSHTGEVTHVDFDCIFEKGARLKIPEIVPFRLTPNIMDAFGIFKEKGVFQSTCEVVQRVLRKNSNNIISFLYSFIHDPLIESNQNIRLDINEGLDLVKKKLYGQISADKGGSLTIEEQVEQVILHALNDESLSKMYIGWMPWL